MKPIIRVRDLGKQFVIGARQFPAGNLREAITEAVRQPLKRLRWNRATGETFWALKDVSFDVMPGEVFGIIGSNGAGKSTLLKILSRITEPTIGRAEVFGRLGSLLEVGTGFHPELTGRENVYLNGSILGISRKDIDRKFDEIVAFSEVERFIDTAVKHYSSGMYVRLAFAVAAHLEPEVLLVDEVLSVGDAAFQTKCLGKMNDVAMHGRTVVFISHNLQAVSSLCQRVGLLESGRLVEFGRTSDVIANYLKGVTAFAESPLIQTWESPAGAPGNENVRLRALRIIPEDGREAIDMETPFRIEVEYWNQVPGTKMIVNFALYSMDGTPSFETLSLKEGCWHGQSFPRGLYRSVCHIPGDFLNSGTYRLRVAFLDDTAKVLYDNLEASIFSVHDVSVRDFPWYGRFIGHVHPKFRWVTELLEDENGNDASRAAADNASLTSVCS